MKTYALALILFAATLFAARQPFTADDRWGWRSASDPRISADGQWIVYVEGWNDRTADAAFANLWIVSSDGKTRRPFTEGNWRDHYPRWSPDGKRIAWLSSRTGRQHIRVRPLEAGPETQIATDGQVPLNLAWSPDGDRIAFTARVPAKLEPPAWAPAALLPRLSRPEEGHVQLFVVPISGGAARRVSIGDFDYHGEPTWMPDGQSILASRDDGAIYALSLSGGPARQVTHEPGRNEDPSPSSDGSKIAWLAAGPRQQSYVIHKLYVMNADGSRVKMLGGALDRDPVAPQWSSDSRTVYFLADDRGATHVYAARNDGAVRQVTSAVERLTGFSLADNGRAVAVRSSATEAGDVVSFTVDHVSQPVTLASPNDRLLADRDIGAVEGLSYDSSGNAIQAWIVKPPRFDASRKYPLLLDIRDDPREMYGVDFNLRAQIFAANGYVVLCVNPRGTPGSGEQFGNLLHSRFPGDDYDDLMRGVDVVVSKGYVDPKRLVVVGGLLAAWTIGHTDRFRAAVARRPIADWTVDVATAPDGLERALRWMGAMPWDDPEQYWKHSPIYFAQNFKTPTLVLAGEVDPGSEELYFALRAKKVDAALVRMGPGEKPSESVLEMNTILAWLGR